MRTKLDHFPNFRAEEKKDWMLETRINFYGGFKFSSSHCRVPSLIFPIQESAWRSGFLKPRRFHDSKNESITKCTSLEPHVSGVEKVDWKLSHWCFCSFLVFLSLPSFFFPLWVGIVFWHSLTILTCIVLYKSTLSFPTKTGLWMATL